MRNHDKYLHKLIPVLLVLITALVVAGCVRTVAPSSEPTEVDTSKVEEVLSATPIPPTPTKTNTPEPTEEPTNTPEPPAPTDTPEPTSTLEIITPTHTESPTEEPDPDVDETPEPTNTPAPQPTSDVPQINPDLLFTGAHHVDSMDVITMWTDESGVLPDSQYIKLEMDEDLGLMYVTGKESLWDTWWISGFTLTNFYIEMDVNSGDCHEGDAYGMILRASQHGEPTRGYLIGFTCEGEVFARRLESVTPYVSISILNPTETNLIYAGANQDNTLGVQMEGNKITIYANRRYFTIITDDGFGWGRYGLYVSTGETGNYTYTVKEIRSWGIPE